MKKDPDHKARDAAWNRGYDAHRAGQLVDACPEPIGTIFFDDWCDGWNESKMDWEDK